MASFYDLYENSQTGRDLWFKPNHADTGYDIIKKGLEFRADREDGETFWDDFIAILGQNTEDAAKLLDVPREKIARWPGKIKKVLDMVREENDNEDKDKKKSTMIPTGIKAG